MRGPTGDIIYTGSGNFSSSISGLSTQHKHFDKISLVLGGSGLTPGSALMARIARTERDNTQVKAVYASRTEEDILVREELD